MTRVEQEMLINGVGGASTLQSFKRQLTSLVGRKGLPSEVKDLARRTLDDLENDEEWIAAQEQFIAGATAA